MLTCKYFSKSQDRTNFANLYFLLYIYICINIYIYIQTIYRSHDMIKKYIYIEREREYHGV